MGLDLPADLESRVADYAQRANVTPDEALRGFVEDGLRRRESPGWALIGLFSSPEDAAIMDEVDALIEEGRRHEMSLEQAAVDVDA